KPVKPRNLISHVEVPPPTPSLAYTARTTAPRGRRPTQASKPAQSIRKQPPRQAKAAKPDKPKPAQRKSKAKPATQTTPRPRGRPPQKPATKRGPKSPPKATPKATPKPRSQPSKQLNKVSKRTTTPRNPNPKPPPPPPPTQIIETTHVRLRKPYPASIREPPFLPGRPAPVPQITIVSAPATDKGGRKRKSDDNGITTRSGKRVRFNVGGGREEEEEEEEDG
ncbi:MAG: hypothetical protein Q9204_008657, partial [Flavoplaca sp. TL-2023a]